MLAVNTWRPNRMSQRVELRTFKWKMASIGEPTGEVFG